MATLNKLRNSKWVLFVVLLSLGLFVASDYFSSSNKYGQSGSQAVGEIDGKDVSLLEFDAKYKTVMEQMANNGMPETEDSRAQASTYAWNQFLQEYIIDKEYEKLGIDISVDESGSLLYSDNAHPTIQQYFSQFSEDGVFRPANVIMAKNRAKKDEKVRVFFENVVQQVFLDVLNKKYNSIIAKSIYATSLDVEDDYYASQTTMTGKSVSLSYSSIEDKTIKVTDDELKAYISKHKDEFKQTESRDLEYVLINVAPSKEDTLALREELAEDMVNFASTEDDSLYTVLNGVAPYNAEYKFRGSFNKDIESSLFSAPTDTVIGPFYYDGGYSIFKVTKTKEDSLGYYHAIKAEIPVKGTTKNDTAAAIALGKKIGIESRGAANRMEFLNTKANAGELSYAYDLGWIKEGSQSDAEMNKALKTLGPGESTVIKSPYGLSLVILAESKSNKLIQVAEVRRLVAPLKSTEDVAFQKALNFRNSLTGAKGEFEAKTQKAGIAKSVANNVKESDRTMTSIPGTLDVVRWAFAEEREEGDYSDVIANENMLIVAHLVRIKEEGTAKVDDAREKVTKLVINEKKAAILLEKFNSSLKTAKTIEDIAVAVKSTVQPFDRLNFYAPNVQFAGNDIKLVGLVCGLKPKVLSKPVVSNDGVHIFYVESVSKPELPTDGKERQKELYGQKKQQAYNLVFDALKKYAKVKDERYKFY